MTPSHRLDRPGIYGITIPKSTRQIRMELHGAGGAGGGGWDIHHCNLNAGGGGGSGGYTTKVIQLDGETTQALSVVVGRGGQGSPGVGEGGGDTVVSLGADEVACATGGMGGGPYGTQVGAGGSHGVPAGQRGCDGMTYTQYMALNPRPAPYIGAVGKGGAAPSGGAGGAGAWNGSGHEGYTPGGGGGGGTAAVGAAGAHGQALIWFT